jgi:hypothetical protein
MLIERGEYEARLGEREGHDFTSFPSGHATGVAAARLTLARTAKLSYMFS